MKTKTFWLDNFEGTAKGGYYLRNDLIKFFEKLEAEGLNPVGIKFDGSWNLEIIVES